MARTRHLCYLATVQSDSRFFQASGPFTLEPGRATSIVVAYIQAAPVNVPGLDIGGDVVPGVPFGGDSIFANPNKLRVIDRIAGWVNQNDANGDHIIEQNEVTTVPRSLLNKALIAQSVFDNGFPSLSSTNSFILIVNEVNSAPTLILPADQTIYDQVQWSTNATAVDTDQPPNTLTFGLVSGPSGLNVDPGGLISWTPTEAQAATTNAIVVRVFDNGAPSLSATNSFVVTVRPSTDAPPPVIQAIALSNGVVTITWSAVNGRSYTLERKGDLEGTNWTIVSTPGSVAGPTVSASEPLGDAQQRFYRVTLQP